MPAIPPNSLLASSTMAAIRDAMPDPNPKAATTPASHLRHRYFSTPPHDERPGMSDCCSSRHELRDHRSRPASPPSERQACRSGLNRCSVSLGPLPAHLSNTTSPRDLSTTTDPIACRSACRNRGLPVLVPRLFRRAPSSAEKKSDRTEIAMTAPQTITGARNPLSLCLDGAAGRTYVSTPDMR